MKKIQYLFILSWLTVPTLIQFFLNISFYMGHFYSIKVMNFLSSFLSVFTPIPTVIPWPIRLCLLILVAIIGTYRFSLFIKNKKIIIPDEFSGLPVVFSKIALYSFLGFVVISITSYLALENGGSTFTPAAMLLKLTIICASVSFLITELKSSNLLLKSNA